jgi:hypothetical protein
MKNALLDVSALDVEKQPDIDPNSLLAWLRSQENVEDRRNPYAARFPSTPNMKGLFPLGTQQQVSIDRIMAPSMGDEMAGRTQPDVMPYEGREGYNWRMSMSNDIQGMHPQTVEEMMAIIQRNRIALEQEEAERRRSLEQNSDSAMLK